MYTLTSKQIDYLYKYNQVAKSNFTHYYLRYNGDGASTLQLHKGEDRLSLCTTMLPIYEVFQALGVTADELMFIDSIALYRAFNKKTKVEKIYRVDDLLYVRTSNMDSVKGMNWEIDQDEVIIPFARIFPYEGHRKSFDVTKPIQAIPDFVEIDQEVVETIMKRQMVRMTHNGEVIAIGKPLLPNIGNKVKLAINFQPHEDGLFKAHFRIEKEQVFNYHTYIAYSIFN